MNNIAETRSTALSAVTSSYTLPMVLAINTFALLALEQSRTDPGLDQVGGRPFPGLLIVPLFRISNS